MTDSQAGAPNYQVFETTLPQPLWWSVKKRLAQINQHNKSHGLAGFKIREGNLTFVDFEGEHQRLPMIKVGVYAGPPFNGQYDEGRPLQSQWARACEALSQDYSHEQLHAMARENPVYFHTSSVLAAAAAITRIDEGQWVSRHDAGEGRASSDEVLGLLKDPVLFDAYVTDDDWGEARAALTYFRSHRFEPGRSAYMARVAAAIQEDAVNIGNLGLAGSSINAWCRMGSPDAGGNQRELADRTLGIPGERIECQARVDKIIPMEGDYGINYLTLFQDTDTGARISWVNSGQQRFYEGDTYNIRATVKEHETRDSHVQTNVIRVTSPDLRPHLKCDDIEAGKVDPEKLPLEKIMGWFKGAANMDARDEQGRTPLWRLCDLHARCDSSFVEAIEFLHDGGCDASLSDLQGISAQDHLVIAGCGELLASPDDPEEPEAPLASASISSPGLAAS